MQLKALQVTVLNINLSEGRNIEKKQCKEPLIAYIVQIMLYRD